MEIVPYMLGSFKWLRNPHRRRGPGALWQYLGTDTSRDVSIAFTARPELFLV